MNLLDEIAKLNRENAALRAEVERLKEQLEYCKQTHKEQYVKRLEEQIELARSDAKVSMAELARLRQENGALKANADVQRSLALVESNQKLRTALAAKNAALDRIICESIYPSLICEIAREASNLEV